MGAVRGQTSTDGYMDGKDSDLDEGTMAASTQHDLDRRRSIAFLNWAHALDHFVLLIYPTIVIGLQVVYQRSYSELIALSSTAFVAFGVFASIYHPVGMAMLIEASNARGRTLAFNGVCGNLGVSLAAGIRAALATWVHWRAAFLAPAVICVATGVVYYWLTPDDRHHVNTRQSKPAVP